MTDKEWKELCEWAKSLNNEDVYVHTNKELSIKEWISVGGYPAENLGFFKNGLILGENIISENRTPAQMKSIIENLL